MLMNRFGGMSKGERSWGSTRCRRGDSPTAEWAAAHDCVSPWTASVVCVTDADRRHSRLYTLMHGGSSYLSLPMRARVSSVPL